MNLIPIHNFLAKNRLLIAQKSLVTLPKIKNTSSNTSIDQESGLYAPPPSRVPSFVKLPEVRSFVKLPELNIISKLQDYVFEEKVIFPSDGECGSEESVMFEDDDYVDEEMFCVKDDDGLILKFDRSVSAYDPDDYGSELHLVSADPDYNGYDDACGGITMMKNLNNKNNRDGKCFITDSWEDFVEVNGCD